MGRFIAACLLAAGLTGCATTPPPLPPPVVVVECSLPDELPEREAWIFTPVEIGGLDAVKELGGRNKDLYYVSVRDAEAGRACNTKLGRAEAYSNELEAIIRGGRNLTR